MDEYKPLPRPVSFWRKLLGPGKSYHSGRGFTMMYFDEFEYDGMVAKFKSVASSKPDYFKFEETDRSAELTMLGDLAKEYSSNSIQIVKGVDYAAT